VSHNAIDVGRGGAVSGGGIFVADFDTTTTSSLAMSSNRVRNNSPRGSTITVYGLDRSTLTGNVIANEADRPQADTTPRSLLLLQRVQANKITTTAVTGNVLFGASNLGSIKRPGFQAPLDDWRFANTEA